MTQDIDCGPDSRAIDLMLNDYERELELQAASERELGPTISLLRRSLDRWMADPGHVTEVHDARAVYVAELARWSPALREWVSIRAMGARLEPAIFSMTDRQWHRFNTLQAQEAASSLRPSTLDEDQRSIRRTLLAFEEFAVETSIPE